MNKYQVISSILSEATIEAPPPEQGNEEQQEVKSNIHDPKIVSLRNKAEIIRVKAELLRAKNQSLKAKMERQKLKKQIKSDKEGGDDKKGAAVYPREPQPEQEKQVPQPEVDMNSGDPINNPQQPQQPQAAETTALHEADGDEVDLTQDPQANGGQPEVDPNSQQIPTETEKQEAKQEIAGSKPQTKEEADIARIQAQTREIQAKIGEYGQGGGMPNEMDPSMGGGQIDPATGQPIGGIDPMTGQPMMGGQQPAQPNDPLKGFGDTTDPMARMGMMGGMGGMGMPGQIDPMTGQPMMGDQGPAKTATTIGRLYTLKKIYNRLSKLNKVLTHCPDEELTKLSNVASEAFKIFRMICKNLKTYKEDIDEVIVNYYMLVKDLGEQVERHMKQKHMDTLD